MPRKKTDSATLDLFAALEQDPHSKLNEVPAHLPPALEGLLPSSQLLPKTPKKRGRPAKSKIDQGRIAKPAQSKIVMPPFVYPLDRTKYLICGADEAGRGPLMGNVVAACVLLDLKQPIPGLNDSKKLTEKKREELELEIKERALAFGIGECTPQEIDSMNILHASLEAMRRAYFAMGVDCNLLLVDGNKVPPQLPLACQAVVKGDARVEEIAAASILAKVQRDRELYELDKRYPEYGFASHKGYPTKAHLEKLESLPILDCYRRSYRPVQEILKKRGLMAD